MHMQCQARIGRNRRVTDVRRERGGRIWTSGVHIRPPRAGGRWRPARPPVRRSGGRQLAGYGQRLSDYGQVGRRAAEGEDRVLPQKWLVMAHVRTGVAFAEGRHTIARPRAASFETIDPKEVP